LRFHASGVARNLLGVRATLLTATAET
jgi:hypothetical protein